MTETKKPELLAPAGSLEAYFAAIDSGADAVYLGLKVFSARARAANFSLRDLERLIPYAHGLKKKVYVAMNTLLREDELPLAVETLSALSALDVDAVIIQDLGLYRIINKHFPEIPLHASTQMTVHNSAGMNQLKEMGFKRVVAAREMTLDEIKRARKVTDVEIEAFVHGSMCFSYAGSCFFSSYLGGKSSNRGICVQPCRREYRDGHEELNPFSMGDLSAIELIPDLMNSGIDSFKIEGRMKSVEYVGNVVKAYRLVMDASGSAVPHALSEAKGLLKNVIGRQRTAGFFLSDNPSSITVPGRSGNLGKFAGKVIKKNGDRALFKASVDLHVRDRLRVQNVKTGGRTVFSLKQIWAKGKKIDQSRKGETIEIGAPGSLRPGDALFKTVSHEHRGKNVEAKRRFERLKRAELGSSGKKRTGNIIRRLQEEIIPPSRGKELEGLLIRVGEMREVPQVVGQCDGVIVPLYRATIHNLRKQMKKLKTMRDRVIFALPLVIQEGDLPLYHDVIGFLVDEGFANWQVSNVGHFYLLEDPHINIITSHYLHALNSQAVLQMENLGCRRVSLSIESDAANLEALAARGVTSVGELLVYAHLSLYVSRVKWEKRPRKVCDGQGEGEYLPKERDRLSYVYSETPFSFFRYMKRFKKMGFRNFQIDLSGEGDRPDTYREIIRDFKSGKEPPHCSLMNMEAGLE